MPDVPGDSYAKRKCQEDLALQRSKLASKDLQSEGSPLIEKLQTELKEYKTILKCSVCHDRPKDVRKHFLFKFWVLTK